MFTDEELQTAFREFDSAYFGGQLAGRVRVERMMVPPGVSLEECEDGACKNDGSEIYIKSGGDHVWRDSLIHEMVHAFEFLHPGTTQPSADAQRMSQVYSVMHGHHSPQFFEKLFEVIRLRSGDPNKDLGQYMG